MLLPRIKGWVLAWRLRLHGHKVGRNLISKDWNPFTCSLSSHRTITLGDNVIFGRNLQIWVKHGAELVMGDGCVLGGDSYVRASVSIRWGEHSGAAEHSSIRDANHGTDLGTDFMDQRSVYGPISIGRDVWIGAGCRILKGSKIPDGCVIGANSIVLEKSKLEPNCIYGGSPVRFLKKREAKE